MIMGAFFIVNTIPFGTDDSYASKVPHGIVFNL